MTPPDLTTRAQNAFAFAQDTVKQMITLSTGIFTLTLTFLKDVVPEGTDTGLLEVAWGCYLASILFGLLTLMSLTGTLGATTVDSIYTSSIRVLAGVQVVLFFGALILTLLFGTRVF